MPTGTSASTGALETPLVQLRNAGKDLGAEHLFAKLEYAFPTGNHKYRLARAAVARFRSGLWSGISAASCGHLASSLAHLCAEHGIPCRLFLPRGCPVPIQASPFVLLDVSSPSYLDAVWASSACATAEGLLEATPGSELGTAYRDSLAAIAAEILGCGLRPAAVVCPVGNGTTLAGIHHGFASRTSPMPRHFGAGILNNPLTGAPLPLDPIDWDLEPLHAVQPLDETAARHAVVSSGGKFVRISPDELHEAREHLWMREGLRVHASAAAAFAGWKTLFAHDASLPAGPVVLVLTASA